MARTNPVSPAVLTPVPLIFLLLPAISLAAPAPSDWKFQDAETIHKTFNVSAGSNPKKLLIDNISGAIHVAGYSGSEIQLTAERHNLAESAEALADAKRDVKLDISQQGNYVRLYADGPFRDQDGHSNYRGDRYYGYTVSFDYQVQVPYATEVILKTINHGDITVDHTTANFDLHNLNGAITLNQVSGSGSVNTLNGPVKAQFSKNPAEATSFKTLNGQVDIYFQPNLSADLRFKTFNGHIYTDFDVAPLPIPAGETESKNGKYIFRSNRSTLGRAGHGGPQLSFEAFNGNIRLHAQ